MTRLLKHTNNTDVAIEILKSSYVKEKDIYKCEVMWWNVGPHPAYSMNITQNIEIRKEDMHNWKPYKEKYAALRLGK